MLWKKEILKWQKHFAQDMCCGIWYVRVGEGLWSPRFFHFRVEKSLGVSPLWSIKRYRNFKSLLQNESLYSSLHLLKAVGSQGISGSKEQSMFLRLCNCTVLPLSFLLRNWKSTSQIIPLSICTAKMQILYTCSSLKGSGLECSVFPGNFFFWKHTF